jgi:glutamate N-acetyltransferase/amino-acid N-acetyltransferase
VKHANSTEGLPSGFRAAATRCGIRRSKSRLDLGLLCADEAIPLAAVYTRSHLLGSHIPVCREKLAATGGRTRAILVNSGNANCSTGQQGLEDNRAVAAAAAELIGCAPEEVLFLSTGVIGERLPMDNVLEALPTLCGAGAQQGLDAFAQSILTTDLVPKISRRTAGDAEVLGIAKGSGMIHPDMATMFGFLLTDADLGEAPLERLRTINQRSFQRLTVDGDTSPNDTVVLWGSGRSGSEGLDEALTSAARSLSRKIAVDGEGATRLVTVEVRGATDEASAARVARVVATSPLVKTAVHGRDPNWGRILAAAARAGVPMDIDRARVWIGEAVVYSDGSPHPDAEHDAHLHLLQHKEVRLGVDLGAGTSEADAWTCDFSADYVRINADYRS